MNRRTLLLLGTAAAVAAGAAVLFTPDRIAPSTVAGGGAGLAFEGLAARLQNAARIEIRKPDGALALLRQGEAWVLPEKGGYPVRPEKVRELLVGLTELRLVEPRTADPAQHDRLGVEDPARPGSKGVLLRVLDAQGAALVELVLGRRRVRTQGNLPEGIYVRRPGEDQAWLAEGRLPADADPQLWLDRDIANLPNARIRGVQVQREGEPALQLERGDGPEAPLRLVQPAGAAPADEVALDEIGRAFEFLTFLEVKPAAELPGAPLGESRFELDDGLSVTARPQREGELLWLHLGASGGAEAERLEARWRGWAYQVGVWKEKAFAPRLEDLAVRPANAPSGDAPSADPAMLPAGPSAGDPVR